MKNIIPIFNWQEELENMNCNAVSIDEDFILLDNFIMSSVFKNLFKIDVVACIIVLNGEMKGKTDLKPYHLTASSMMIILPDQVLEYEYVSSDFQGKFIIMSKRFLDSLGVEDRFSMFVSVRDNPSVALNAEALEAMVMYYAMMRRALSIEGHPHRLEVAKNLTRAFFYGAGYYFHDIPDDETKTKNEILVENFLKLVQTHFKRQRGVEFYAGKLCLTSKYMSTVIKQASGKPAGDWIDDYVMLEAKALLKSTNMTIQQISDELNFPSQSFFGKYFKRLAGMSPKEYRKG